MKLQKGRSDDGGLAASPMIKSEKSTGMKKKEVLTVWVASFYLVRDFPDL